MANTYHQIYIQAVFAVKYRDAVIGKAWEADLFAVIGNLVTETSCKTIIVNGMEDHVHCFFGLKPSVAISAVLKTVKAKSSKWVNESGHLRHKFEWQEGYGAFSYSRSHIDSVYKYIQNQEEHHKNRTFLEEYIELLERFGVEYDKQYIFKELI